MSQSAIIKKTSEDGMVFMEIQKRAIVEYFSGELSEGDVKQYISEDLIKFITVYRNDKYKVSDEKVQLWLFNIAPSCVNLKKNNEGENRHQCHFCNNYFKKTQLLVRHYREQHFDDLPEKIFGEQYPFECSVCVVKFKRVEHLNYHMQTKEHLNKSQGEFSSSDEEVVDVKAHSTRATTKRKIEEETEGESKKAKRESLVTFSQAIEILNDTTDSSLEYLSSSEELLESMTSTPIKQEEVSIRVIDSEDEDDQILIRALIEYESRFNVEKLSQTLSQSSL